MISLKQLANRITAHGDWISFFWAVLMFGLVLIPIFWIIQFVHPSSDDFCFSHNARELGVFDAIIYNYFNWTGRYVSVFFLSINPLVFDSYFGYRMVPFLLLLMLLISSYLYIYVITGRTSTKYSFVISVLFIFTFFVQIPDLTQGIYWIAGSLTYMLPAVFFSFLIYSAQQYVFYKRNWILYIAAILSLLIVGSNESSLLMLNFLVLTVYLFSIYFRWRLLKRFFLVVLVSSIVFSLVAIVAPGNYVRMEESQNGAGFFYSVVMSIVIAIRHIIRWAPIALPIALILMELLKSKFDLSFLNDFKKLHPAITFFILIIVVAIGFFPSFISIGTGPPSRTVNAIYFLFVQGFFLWVVHFVVYMNWKAETFVLHPFVMNTLLFLLIMIFLAENPIRNIYKDLTNGKIQSYNQEQNLRLDILLHDKDSSLILRPLLSHPESLYNSDIDESSNNWKNRCMADYFKKVSITLNNNE